MSCATPTKFKVNIMNETGKVTGTYSNVNDPSFQKKIKDLRWPIPQNNLKSFFKEGTVSTYGATANSVKNFHVDHFNCYLSKRCENNSGVIDYTCLSLSPYKLPPNKLPSTSASKLDPTIGCPNINIHNSKHEWDVIHGVNRDEHKIHCNDGYSFNHDLFHQGGTIQCASIPNPSPDSKNKYDWYIKDDYLESKCEAYGKETCEPGAKGKPPSYNPYQNLFNLTPEKRKELETLELNITGNKNVPIGCVWDNKADQCIFRKKVNVDHSAEPLCKALHCPQKNIPYSNKADNFPLPGPKHGKDRGNCEKPDGSIVKTYGKKEIDNAHDCLCRQHKSCNTCTYDNNCKWCGKECYYTHSYTPACSTPIKQSGIGTCKNTITGNPNPDFYNKPLNEQTIDNCEIGGQCIKNSNPKGEISNWKSTYIKNYQDRQKVTWNLNDKELCHAYNNKWNSSGKKKYDYMCSFVNNKSKNTGSIEQPIPFHMENKKRYISIAPNYCLGKETVNNPTCSELKEDKCDINPLCTWSPNLLNDDNLNWTEGDKVMIYGSDKGSCNLCKGKDDISTNVYSQISSGEQVDKGHMIKTDKECSTAASKLNITYKKLCEKCPGPGPQNSDKCCNTCELAKKAYEAAYGDSEGKESDLKQCQTKTSLSGCVYNNTNSGKQTITFIDDKKWYSADGTVVKSAFKSSATLSSSSGLGCTSLNKGRKEGDIPYFTVKKLGPDKQYISELHKDDLNVTIDTVQIPTKCNLQYYNPEYTTTNITNLDTKLCNNLKLSRHISAPSNNCQRILSNTEIDKREQCNNTYHKILNTGTYDKKYDGQQYGECSLATSTDTKQLNRQTCELLNKNINGNRTVHWGPVCNRGVDDKFISHKAICKSKDFKWKKKNDYSWGCYDTKGTLQNNLCNEVSPKGPKGSKREWQKGKSKCIVEIPGDMESGIVKEICEKWKSRGIESDVEFTYKQSNKKIDTNEGICESGKARPTDQSTKKNKVECEYDNNTYQKKYVFSNSEFCKGDKSRYIEPDENLNWTGGEIKSDNNDNWKSDCSSTILSTCQVNCDTGYGGGGDFVCHYNNHSDKVCGTIQQNYKGNANLPTMCNRYVNCMYDDKTKTCSSINNENDKDTEDKISGQMEWLGPECYKLNNDAFAHGTYNYPTLDEAFPPFTRLLFMFFIVLKVLVILFLTGLLGFILDKLFGSIVSTSIISIFKGFNIITSDFKDGLLDGRIFKSTGHIVIIFITIVLVMAIVRFFHLKQYNEFSDIQKIWTNITGEYDKIDNEVIDDVNN